MNEQLAEAIRATQDELSGLFTRPKLTEKLLSKPPFRFLHDLVSAVTQSTGFLEGLYGVEELDSASIKDKAGKMAYLDKLIACVGICEGGAIDVRSAKIVAGLDPENTNALLAAMGRCSKSSELDWPEAVKRALAGESPGERRPPMKRRPSRAEAKDIEEKGEEEEVKRTPHLEDAPQSASDPAAPYGRRLSSRGGTRSGRGASEMPPQGLGLDENTAAQLGKDLGADIEACDGSMELTRSMLEKLITRPKLADKLLGKPPFRFLHDIITEITLATGFATGLFADQPALLDSANVKDKATKILYLERIVALVGRQLSTIVDTRPAKVVAGLEPESTNRFLQLLALAATELPDSSMAVKSVLGEDAGPPVELESAPTGAGIDAHKPVQEDRRASAVSSTVDVDSHASAGSRRPSTSKLSNQVAPSVAEAKDAAAAPLVAAAGGGGGEPFAGRGADIANGNGGLEESGMRADEKRSMRPRTARRRPPPVKDNATEVENPPPPSEAKAKAVAGIMTDGTKDDDSDDDEGVGVDQAVAGGADPLLTGNKGHTAIVQSIIDEQAKNTDAKGEVEPGTAAGESGIRLGRLKKSGVGGSSGSKYSDGDVTNLRASIQVLCQSTAPLGRCMDYVHEDLTMMAAETEKWKAEFERKRNLLEGEKIVSEDELHPLHVQLMEVEEQMKEQLVKINGVKANIIRNDERIKQLLRLAVSH